MRGRGAKNRKVECMGGLGRTRRECVIARMYEYSVATKRKNTTSNEKKWNWEGKSAGCLGHGGNGGRAQLYRGLRMSSSRGKGTVGGVRVRGGVEQQLSALENVKTLFGNREVRNRMLRSRGRRTGKWKRQVREGYVQTATECPGRMCRMCVIE